MRISIRSPMKGETEYYPFVKKLNGISIRSPMKGETAQHSTVYRELT